MHILHNYQRLGAAPPKQYYDLAVKNHNSILGEGVAQGPKG